MPIANCECGECDFLRRAEKVRLSTGLPAPDCTCGHAVYHEGCGYKSDEVVLMPAPPKYLHKKAEEDAEEGIIKRRQDLKPRGTKPQVQMHPVAAMYWGARVFEYGAKKYARGNFRLPVEGESPWIKTSEYIRAAIGHLLQASEQIERFLVGLDSEGLAIDEESKLPHLAHALCSVEMAITAGTDGGIFPRDPGSKEYKP